jgi:hypothetical protein
MGVPQELVDNITKYEGQYNPDQIVQGILAKKDKYPHVVDSINGYNGKYTPQQILEIIKSSPIEAGHGVVPAFKSGYSHSTLSEFLGNKQKDMEPEGMVERLSQKAGETVGDIPAMAIGGIAGGVSGGPLGATAGMFAFPAAAHRVLESKDKTMSDVAQTAVGALKEAGKGYALGAATELTGGAARAIPFVGKAFAPLAEVGTMTAGGAAMEGRIPTAQEFLDNAVLLGGIKMAGKTVGILKRIYTASGDRPEVVIKKAKEKTPEGQAIREEFEAEGIPLGTLDKGGPKKPREKTAASEKKEASAPIPKRKPLEPPAAGTKPNEYFSESAYEKGYVAPLKPGEVNDIPPRYITAAHRALWKLGEEEGGEQVKLEDGMWGGYESTNPEFFKNKGYSKAEARKVLGYAIDNHEMTEIQKDLFYFITGGERSEAAREILEIRRSEKEERDKEGPADKFPWEVKKPGGVTLYSMGFLDPEILGERLGNAWRGLKASYGESAFSFKTLFDPGSIDEDARIADGTARKMLTQKAQRDVAIRTRTKELHQVLGAFDRKRQHQFMDAMTRGVIWEGELGQIMKFITKEFDECNKREAAVGIKYEYRNHYFPGYWKDGVRAMKAFMTQMKQSMGKASFAKAKEFEFFSQALAAGKTPLHDNPIDMLLKRIEDSNRLIARQETMDELVNYGVVLPRKGNTPPDFPHAIITAPNEKDYYVPESVAILLKNAQMLRGQENNVWTGGGLGARSWQAMMSLKNTVVPLKLLGLFHPIHILGIDAANSATENLHASIEGGQALAKSLERIGKSSVFATHIDDIKYGWSAIQAFKKDQMDSSLSDADREIVRRNIVGGMNPLMSEKYRTRAMQGFKEAVRNDEYLKATWKGIQMSVERIQRPVFEMWIPALKQTAYLKAVDLEYRNHPELHNDPIAEGKALGEIAKSIENRYGEFNYDVLFWHPFIKTAAIGSSLSMGWNLGFLREMGGAMTVDTKNLVSDIRAGRLDKSNVTRKMLFTALYTFEAALVGSLITWYFTGEKPKDVFDAFYPRTGDKNPDGSPVRLQTWFYAKEFFSYWAHARQEGVVGGAAHYMKNKLNPVLADIWRVWDNVDFYNREIRNPNDNIIKQIGQVADYMFTEDITPISVGGYRRNLETGMPEDRALGTALLGLPPAPSYITRSPLQQDIFAVYDKRHGTGIKSESEKEKENARTDVRKLYQLGKWAEANAKLNEAVQKGYIKEKSVNRFIKDSDLPSDIRLFRQLEAPDQEALLARMTYDELEKYAWFAKPDATKSLYSISDEGKQFIERYLDLIKKHPDLSGEKIRPKYYAGKIVRGQLEKEMEQEGEAHDTPGLR